MINIDSVALSYQGELLFDEASFSVQKGERLGLLGRNGSGKTTIFRLITGQEEPDKGTISCVKGYRIGILSQHIVFHEKTILAEASLGLKDKDCVYKVESILFGLGFTDGDMDRNPNELSGGYQLRLHLAKVLVEEPDCLLLDEPTNYLDIISIRWFEKFLKQYRGEFILITHDRAFLDTVTTHIIGIHRKKVKKVTGSSEEYFRQILLEEEVHEKTRMNLSKKKEHMERFIERFHAKASKAAQAGSRKKMVDKMPSLERLAELSCLTFSFKEASFSSKNMIEVKDLSFAYQTPLIQDVSLSIEKGDRIAFIGKNGKGKSTLLRLLTQELPAQKGTISSSEHVRVGYFGQTNIDRLDPKNSVFHEISRANPKMSVTEVRSICGLMMFQGVKADKPTAILSGGEKSRVLLGTIVASPCNILLLDEPTHHLDMESIEALIEALEEFQGAIVLVTHSEHLLERFQPDKIILFQEGEQSFFLGNYEEFLEKKGWPDEKPAQKEKKQVSFQQEKQQRAEQLRKRAQALKPLEQAIQQAEKKIAVLELEQQKENQQLIDASLQHNSALIQSVSLSLSARSILIEGVYSQLESLLQQKEAL
jgi:ATP-binding cassette subfamily F protein 3